MASCKQSAKAISQVILPNRPLYHFLIAVLDLLLAIRLVQAPFLLRRCFAQDDLPYFLDHSIV
jgi:hypothetical protein